MISKKCKAPSKGGSARGAIRYILGYELGADKENTRESHAMLLQEAQARSDGGAGEIWAPVAGNGRRPALVLAKGVASLVTADYEMESIAAANPRCHNPVHHFVFSFSENERAMTQEERIRAAEAIIEKMGLGEHQAVYSLHMDTENPHVHVAVASVNPYTLRTWNQTRKFNQMAWVTREVEIEMGLEHGRGAAMIDEVTGRVRWATADEKKAWTRENREERLDDLARKIAGDYADFEDVGSWVRNRVAPKIGAALKAAQERGEPFRAADVHKIAAQNGVRLETTPDGRLFATVMERIPKEERDAERLRKIEADPELKKLVAYGEKPFVRVQTYRAGEKIELSLHDVIGESKFTHAQGFGENEFTIAEEEKRFAREQFLQTLSNVEQSETEFAQQVRADVSLVSRELRANGHATFTRAEIDEFISSRITDVDVALELADYIENNDPELVMISADTENPLYSTRAQTEMETATLALAEQRVRADVAFDANALVRAKARLVEQKRAEQIARGDRPTFALTQEQDALLDGVKHGLSWCNGDAGTGKTTAMLGLAMYAQETGVRVVGLSLSEKASRELGNAANVEAYNLAKALHREARGEKIFVRGDIVILDETSMTSYSALRKVLEIANERECRVFGIGDKAQLPAIEAGRAHDLMSDLVRRYGAYTELTEVRRQKSAELSFMAGKNGNVARMGSAIRDGREFQTEVEREGKKTQLPGIYECTNELAAHGIFSGEQDRTAAVDAAVAYYFKDPKNTLMLAGDRDTCAHLNDRIMARLEAAGERKRGVGIRTDEYGVRDFAIGDRIAFLKNDSRLKADNGDLGTIVAMQPSKSGRGYMITVKKDDGQTVAFNSAKYNAINHGWASTIHKGQGSTVKRCVGVIDKSVSAELLHVLSTRAEEAMKVFYSSENFNSPDDLARHVAKAYGRHDDALLLEKIIARTGGPDTLFAKRAREAMAKENDPLHIEHLRENAAKQNDFQKTAQAIQEKYARLAVTMPAESTKAELRKLVSAQQSELQKARDAAKPVSFAAWLGENHRRIERAASDEVARKRIEREDMKQQSRDDLRTAQDLRDEWPTTKDRNDARRTTDGLREVAERLKADQEERDLVRDELEKQRALDEKREPELRRDLKTETDPYRRAAMQNELEEIRRRERGQDRGKTR